MAVAITVTVLGWRIAWITDCIGAQIRAIRKKMVEIMQREASACDLKELVGKFIPESIGEPPMYLGVGRPSAAQPSIAGC